MRPPSMGNAGSKLKAKSETLVQKKLRPRAALLIGGCAQRLPAGLVKSNLLILFKECLLPLCLLRSLLFSFGHNDAHKSLAPNAMSRGKRRPPC